MANKGKDKGKDKGDAGESTPEESAESKPSKKGTPEKKPATEKQIASAAKALKVKVSDVASGTVIGKDVVLELKASAGAKKLRCTLKKDD